MFLFLFIFFVAASMRLLFYEEIRARLCKLQKGCTRLAVASDNFYQLLAHGRWFSPGNPVSSATKAGRHDIAEILLKLALKRKKKNQINQSFMKLTNEIPVFNV